MRAQGEARSAELIGEAVRTSQGFLQLRRLEAAREIASILSTSGNKVMLDSQSLLLNGKHLIVLFAIRTVKLTNAHYAVTDDAKDLLNVHKKK